jgi:DNA-binding HxlR family transcriptional regulator
MTKLLATTHTEFHTEVQSTRSRQCVAAAAAVLSSKWTPQIIYAVSHGVRRFCNLQKEVGGVNPRTLSARLDELERAGILAKVSYPEVPPRVEYTLTSKGRDLLPILNTMAAWGDKYARASSVDC